MTITGRIGIFVRILALDTSNQTLSVAVCEDETILGVHTINIKKNHSITLAPSIEKLMNEIDCKPKELDRIVVAQGPGSYTGLRIGVTTAKTLAYTLNKELVGVSSLAVLAANCMTVSDLIIPIFNARRNYVYTGAYRYVNGKLENVLADRYILLDTWLQQLQTYPALYFVGQDVADFLSEIKVLAQAEVCQFPQWQLPNAVVLAQLGSEYETIKNIHSFSPNYLKLVEAEENWLKNNENRIETYVEKS